MAFQSILFRNSGNLLNENKVEENEPDFFSDLNLDQVINAITSKKEVYNLKPFFYTKLNEISTIEYRQKIMFDFENGELYSIIEVFAKQIREMFSMLSRVKKSFYKNEKERLFLDAVFIYINAVILLKNKLSKADLKSIGFLEL